MILYRAAKTEYLPRFACFAEDRSDAEYYLDNPGFGGPVMYKAKVTGRVLRVDGTPSECLRQLLEEAGVDVERVLERNLGSCCGSVLGDYTEAHEILSERFDWIVFTDSAPEDCRTWMCLAEWPGDFVEMEEV